MPAELELVSEEEDLEELEPNKHLVAFVNELMKDHLKTHPPKTFSKDTIAEWSERVLSVLEDGFTSDCENLIEELEESYLEPDEDDEGDGEASDA